MEDRPIQRLGEELIGKIAAGEVVENPASAIKEMVENSLDSGANCITVEIRDGGISFIRVTDNGRGIRSRDIRMAFERHATSKIATTDDLFNLSTLGFRGEALASIAAVSKLTLTTHRTGESVGTRAINEGGVIREITEAAAPQGTTIVVRDLFFNTPVRLKFLKKPTTEASKVAEVLQRLILSRPDISFRFLSNGRQIYSSSGNGDLKSAVYCLYGRETAENMVPVYLEGSVSINGLIGVGQEARANRGRQTFIINGRSIRSPLLSQAVEDGARERYTIGHYPVCVIRMEMPATLVDVNVHPNKLEVRFSDENLIYQKLCQAVHDAFSISPLSGAPEMIHQDGDRPEPVPMQVVSTENGPEQAAAVVQVVNSGSVSVQELEKDSKPEKNQEDVPVTDETSPNNVFRQEAPEMTSPHVVQSAEPAMVAPSVSDEKKRSETPRQNDLDFASIVANYFAGGGSTRETPPVRETAQDDQPETMGDPAPKKQDSIAALYSKPSEPKKAASEGDQIRFIGMSESLEQRQDREDAFAGYDLIGVAFDTYILLQNKKQILMIDQHAAHERILYERLMRELDQGGGSQLLLVPMIVHVTPQEAVKIETYREEITAAGYEIEPFGETDYQIRAVPNVLGQPETRAAFLEMVDRLGELRVLTTRQKRRDAILQMACKKAIKGGDRLEPEEISALLKEMQRTGAPPTCPHGRPLVVILNRTEIEKKFRRIND